MIPTIARKKITLASGTGNLELGFLPDYVQVFNLGVLDSTSSGDTVSFSGKPEFGSSDSELIALQVDTSNAISFNKVPDAVCKRKSDTFYGLAFDVTSYGGIANGAELMVVAMRSND